MKILSDVIENIQVLESHGNVDVSISDISINSGHIKEHSMFIAIEGSVTDGHKFISDCIKKGARVVVHQSEIADIVHGVTYVRVADTKKALGTIVNNFYNHPSRKLKLIGITGTSGKTTVATLLHQLFRHLGHKVGMMGTVVNKINDESFAASITTPDSVTLNDLLSRMVDAGCEYCFMEVSSHSVSEKRIEGLDFAGGVFTNLTHDHLDYHKTLDAYREAKKEFFDILPETAFTLSNTDDESGEYMLSTTKAQKHFYGLKKPTNLPTGQAGFSERFKSKLIGEFNAYNLAAVSAVAVLLGQNKDKVRGIVENLEPVEGRFNYIKSASGVIGIVDYAHKPDALDNVLRTVKDMVNEDSTKEKGRVITVLGCGGDRDKAKRPMMAKIAYDMSDIVILTSDNPRTEPLEKIIDDMQEGVFDLPKDKVHVIFSRHEAIMEACSMAKPGDYILIAGKGHEKYQEINGEKTHFDDMEELKKYIK